MLLLLLWAVMLSAGTRAQSGEPDLVMEPKLDCQSHISYFEGSNITCRLVSSCYNLGDDEDEDCDTIVNLTACCEKRKTCVKASGETVSSKHLNPLCLINVTAVSKRGHRFETNFMLKTIIKPKSPQVYNVTINQDQALVHVQIPYEKDYLQLENQRFQIQLWSEKTNLTQNMTSASMNIGWNHLSPGTQYHVKVRSIPWKSIQGTWSEWSQVVTFNVTPGNPPKNLYVLVWSIIPVVAVGIMVFMQEKIRTYMWPSIPHPKTTLKQICRPSTGLLLIYNPEEFSSLNIYSSTNLSATPSCTETQSMLSSDGTEETLSSPSLSNSSVWTEELELLSQGSTSEGKSEFPIEALPSENTLQQVEAPESTPMEHNNKQHEGDNSYVTMSSFYQIKTVGTNDKTFSTNHSAT